MNLTDQQLNDIEARANAATDGPWERYDDYGPNFFANTSGEYLRGVGDFNFGVGEQAEADEEFVKHARGDVDALVAEVRRLRARQLTESEYNAAWHAVEGAAGEEGADPGTVLHSVLDRLGIEWQDAARPAGVQEQPAEACGKCQQPFDPADTRFDGHARHRETPWCRRCVDLCHDNEIADHRCVICAPADVKGA